MCVCPWAEVLGKLLSGEAVLRYHSAEALGVYKGKLVTLWNGFQESRVRVRQALS